MASGKMPDAIFCPSWAYGLLLAQALAEVMRFGVPNASALAYDDVVVYRMEGP